jgi:hypothetical protein
MRRDAQDSEIDATLNDLNQRPGSGAWPVWIMRQRGSTHAPNLTALSQCQPRARIKKKTARKGAVVLLLRGQEPSASHWDTSSQIPHTT